MNVSAKIGDGDEYELPADLELIVADPKAVVWRKQRFVAMGFSMSEADTLSRYRSADLHDVERWLGRGCTHAQALELAMPLVPIALAVETADDPAHKPEYGETDDDEMTGA